MFPAHDIKNSTFEGKKISEPGSLFISLIQGNRIF